MPVPTPLLTPIDSLPPELLDLILSLLCSPTDLLSFALTCSKFKDAVIPRHSEYRILRIRQPEICARVFSHLARREDLTRNIRELHLCEGDNGKSTVEERWPKTLCPELQHPHTPRRQAVSGSSHSAWGEQSPSWAAPTPVKFSSYGQSDQRVRDLIRALGHMNKLKVFTWSNDSESRHGSGWPSELSGYERAILRTLGKRPALRHVQLLGIFSKGSFEKEEEFWWPKGDVSEPLHSLFNMSGLVSVSLISKIDLPARIVRENVVPWLKSLPCLQSLEVSASMGYKPYRPYVPSISASPTAISHRIPHLIPYMYDQPIHPQAPTTDHGEPETITVADLTFPLLRTLKISHSSTSGFVFVNSKNDQEWVKFIENHPNLEELWWGPSAPIKLSSDAVPCLRSVVGNEHLIGALGGLESEEDEGCVDDERREHASGAERDEDWQEDEEEYEEDEECEYPLRLIQDISISITHRPDILEHCKALDHLSVRRLKIDDRYGVMAQSGALERVPDLFLNLEWLGVETSSGAKGSLSTDTWTQLLSRLPLLEVFRGPVLWDAVDNDKNKFHNTIHTLVAYCPNLRMIDHYKFDERRGKRNDIRIFREPPEVEGGAGKVWYKPYQPKPKVPFELMSGTFD